MKLKLSKVTLIAVSSVKIPETILALRRCIEKLDFNCVKIVSHLEPQDLPDGIVFELCPRINNIHDYNHYVFRNLGHYVQTSHCLLAQHDSWILHPELWDDSWLQFDYIGAPWVYSEDAYITADGEHVRVGNGGFSLRSKRLLELPILHDIHLTHDRGYWNEDGNICVYHRRRFLELGVRYAPVEVAAEFAYENPVPENQGVKSFGFHRNYPDE